jgi:hypothetical protein
MIVRPVLRLNIRSMRTAFPSIMSFLPPVLSSAAGRRLEKMKRAAGFRLRPFEVS